MTINNVQNINHFENIVVYFPSEYCLVACVFRTKFTNTRFKTIVGNVNTICTNSLPQIFLLLPKNAKHCVQPISHAELLFFAVSLNLCYNVSKLGLVQQRLIVGKRFNKLTEEKQQELISSQIIIKNNAFGSP